MSYIIDHQEAFANINQDILNIIQEATGAKWAVMLPDKTLISSEFVKDDGKYYSNRNHLWRSYYYNYNNKSRNVKKCLDNMIIGKNLKRNIKKDAELYEDLCDFIDLWCNCDYNMCNMCTKCLKTAKTLRDVKIILNENYYFSTQEEDCVCGIDYYDYETDYNEKAWFDERTKEYWDIFDE